METTLDRFGRIVIPKGIRDDFGLTPGKSIIIQKMRDGIFLKPNDEESQVINDNGLLILTGHPTGDQLKLVQQSRESRMAVIE
jgi:AbrB family looped-hinge helix DNA binding protein